MQNMQHTGNLLIGHQKKCTPSVNPCVPVCVMHVCVCVREREREREMAACVHPLRQETLHAWTQCEWNAYKPQCLSV